MTNRGKGQRTILDRPPTAGSHPAMQVGTVNIHPLGVAVAALNFVVGLISASACIYGVWFILSDWSHITFTRSVVLFFCVWLGSMALAMIAFRIRLWKQLLFRRP
jgi:hypothetical protein